MKMEDSNVISAAKALLSFGSFSSPPPPVSHATDVVSSASTAFRSSGNNLPPSREVFPGVVSSSSSSSSSRGGSESSSVNGSSFEDISIEPNDETHRFYDGNVSLATKNDAESLSPLHCFMRRYCVEAFTATADDISIPRYGKSHSSRVVVGQVGIRCLHCKHRPTKERQERAVCFPSSLKNIYHSIETWQRRHSLVCQDIPDWVKRSLTELIQKSRAGAGGRRLYWEESASLLGMVTTNNGIRFTRRPGEISPPIAEYEKVVVNAPVGQTKPVVDELDKKLVTGYLFTLLDQMEACRFTEQDRIGGRSKVKDCPVGYPGMQCKHCRGKAGFGRYFPASVQALSSANSDRNIYNHVIKCRKCPEDVRQDLQRMQNEQLNSKNRRGSRKKFFLQVWGRMHGDKFYIGGGHQMKDIVSCCMDVPRCSEDSNDEE